MAGKGFCPTGEKFAPGKLQMDYVVGKRLTFH